MSAIISPKVFISATEKSPAIITPKIFISTIEKAPAVVSPKVYISAIEKSPVVVAPKVFISAVEKNPAVLTPKFFISAVPKNPAIIQPKIFISAIDKTEKAIADTLRIIENVIEEIATADTLRRVVDVAKADTLRKVFRTEKAVADTVIRYPHDLNYFFQAPVLQTAKQAALKNSPASLTDTFKDYDLALFEVTLAERTLSDTFALETARQIDINDAFKGTFFDYPFSFLVEETTQRDLFSSVKGMYDIDKLLYSFVEYEIESATVIHTATNSSASSTGYSHKSTYISTTDEDYEASYIKASDYVNKIAEYFGLTPNVKIDNFTPTNLDGDTDITYSDLISSLFSWTSKLPQRQINVFIRGGILYCIQRGKEDAVFDISDIPHSRPTVNKKLIRTLYNNPNKVDSIAFSKKNNSTSGGDSPTPTPTPSPDDEDIPPVDPEYLPEDVPYPYSGTMRYADEDENVYLTYSGGLLMKEGVRTQNSVLEHSQTTTYGYTGYGNESSDVDWYLSSKVVKNTALQKEAPEDTQPSIKIVTESNTKYIYKPTYNDIYLRKEREVVTKQEYRLSKGKWDLVDSETSTRATYHHPVGNGFYATSVYVDGEIQGSSISQGKPGNKISLFTVNETQWALAPTNPLIPNPNNGGNGDSGNGYSGGGSGYSGAKQGKYKNHGLSPIDDTIFPVREVELQNELVEALKWLNRKIQVTVSVDLISKIEKGVPNLKHVVDFTERVKLDGYEYFLVSNKISFTPRKLIQSLQLVRWTE